MQTHTIKCARRLQLTNAFIDSDALIDSDDSVAGSFVSDGARDLKDIVDGLLNSPPSASLGSFPTSRLMMQVKLKLAEIIFEQCSNITGAAVDNPDDFTKLGICDVVNDGFTRAGCRVDSSELFQGCSEPGNGGG